MYILDTNVVSELRKAGSGKADAGVVNWAEKVPANQLYLSVISILELEQGILQVSRRDIQQGKLLRDWLEQHVIPAFQERILPIDLPVALRCAGLHVPDPGAERDTLISATALVHGMTIVTRNTKDFAATGAKLLNPWQ